MLMVQSTLQECEFGPTAPPRSEAASPDLVGGAENPATVSQQTTDLTPDLAAGRPAIPRRLVPPVLPRQSSSVLEGSNDRSLSTHGTHSPLAIALRSE
jgi:hypothetical protein